jgi:hypothetical protein
MTYDLGTDLDQLLPECRQRPMLDHLRQGQCPELARLGCREVPSATVS